ncbi:MAG TPA: thiamine pyrophosphate-dependent enzyme [Gammaproteobacteria bacterium]|nr:thiamine pyrophosphate-dependent enzyme [Gammaproteobacteria bacterium]
MNVERHIFDKAYLVRTVEEQLLELFAAGKLSGTTHTCIGQEMSAVALAAALDRRKDVIVSNHRCHGHYLAWTDDPDGLVAEVMGKSTGVCAGLGGSQHLSAEGFMSNGIQGGIVPVGAGLAFAKKLAGDGGIVAVCIGDGTLGEGVVYETFNMAAKWRLPLLVVLENNRYAQSTSQAETLAGDICARAAAFGMRTLHGETWRPYVLAAQLREAAAAVRHDGGPLFVRVDTYRLAAHSKGDDDRDPKEVAAFARRDPLNVFLAQQQVDADVGLAEIRERVARAIERAAAAPVLSAHESADVRLSIEWRAAALEPGTQLVAINRALQEWLEDDARVLLLGEDIRSPYGGAFKATRGLSDAHPERVINTPISEAGIVGIANGLALAGRRPVVEIMFGDFLGLCFDQLLNHAAKFRGMYNGRVSSAIVVRTPMGGGRGYGPTHSQNIEKHFAGMPGLRVAVLHGRASIAALYAALRDSVEPTLIIENKLLYRESAAAALPPGYEAFETTGPWPTTVLRPAGAPDLTIVAFGRMSLVAEQVAAELRAEEIEVEILLPLSVSPFDARPVVESVARTRKLVVIEEGAAHFDLASEVIAAAAEACRGGGLHARRVAARPRPIPSALKLELEVLPSVAALRSACLELYDE